MTGSGRHLERFYFFPSTSHIPLQYEPNTFPFIFIHTVVGLATLQ
jgi:hypothetical protein